MDLFILLVVIGVIIIVLVAYDRIFTPNISISIFHKDASQNKKCKTEVMSTKEEGGKDAIKNIMEIIGRTTKQTERNNEMNNRTILVIGVVVLAILVLNIDVAYCGIKNDQIKAASVSFIGTMSDWMPAIIGAGLVGSGICLFANNFKMGLAGLAGTGFLYAAKAFVGTGEGALIQMAEQLLKVAS
jgi:hypothetical protein